MRIIPESRWDKSGAHGDVTEFQSKLPEALREFAARLPAAASNLNSAPERNSSKIRAP